MKYGKLSKEFHRISIESIYGVCCYDCCSFLSYWSDMNGKRALHVGDVMSFWNLDNERIKANFGGVFARIPRI